VVVIGTVRGNVPCRVIFSSPAVRVMLDDRSYISSVNTVAFINGTDRSQTCPERGTMPSDPASSLTRRIASKCVLRADDNGGQVIRSKVSVVNDWVYYVTTGLMLTRASVQRGSMYEEPMARVAMNSTFGADGTRSYCAINVYGKKAIIDASGTNDEIDLAGKVVSMRVHRDTAVDQWLAASRCKRRSS